MSRAGTCRAAACARQGRGLMVCGNQKFLPPGRKGRARRARKVIGRLATAERRHLTASQRAAIAAKATEILISEKKRQRRAASGDSRGVGDRYSNIALPKGRSSHIAAERRRVRMPRNRQKWPACRGNHLSAWPRPSRWRRAHGGTLRPSFVRAASNVVGCSASGVLKIASAKKVGSR
jgi:hypothetical protein